MARRLLLILVVTAETLAEDVASVKTHRRGRPAATWRRRSTSCENRSKAAAESAITLMDRSKTGMASSRT